MDYFSHGHVESLDDRGGSALGVVRGDWNYTAPWRQTKECWITRATVLSARMAHSLSTAFALALAWLSRALEEIQLRIAKAKEKARG